MVAAAPAHFLRLEAIGFLLRGHRRLSLIFRQFRILMERLRHQRGGLRRRGECGGASEDACCDPEKFPAFHFFPPRVARDAKRVSPARDECVLNRTFMFVTRLARKVSHEQACGSLARTTKGAAARLQRG
jgi:hypothetical protein